VKITVKTSGLLGQYLPAGSAGNQAEVEVAEDITPQGVIEKLGMPSDGSYLVIRNGETVPKAERATLRLQTGDTLAIVPPLKGG
jgi:thiamine biosynthesis protein ThiS